MAQNASIRNLIGLPEAGVILTGTPDNPTLQNSTGRVILAWTLFLTDGKGAGHVSTMSVMGYLRDGELQPQATINHMSPDGAHRVQATPPGGMGPAVSATLDVVVFRDGEVVGPDKTGMQANMTARIQGEQGVDKLFLDGDLIRLQEIVDQKSLLAPPDGMSRFALMAYNYSQIDFAKELLRVRDRMGLEYASKLARTSARYPNLWRKP